MTFTGSVIKKHEKKERLESNLNEHKRVRKELIPPLAELNFKFSSWINERMPNMLWAILASEFWPREKTLLFFRHVGRFVNDNKDCNDVTLTGVVKYTDENKEHFIKHVVSWSRDTKDMLRPMMLFDMLPSRSNWEKHLEKAVPEKDWARLGDAILKALWHQSDEATDCRWVKVLCKMLGGKLHFAETMKETPREFIEYPNYGDIQHARAMIRSIEISVGTRETEGELSWPEDFWKTCFEKTCCFPEKNRIVEKLDADIWSKQREHYVNETQSTRIAIINHFCDTCSNTGINPRHEACFGFALYAFTLFTDIIFYQLDYALSGRLILRSLIECLIVFRYLLDKDDIELWKSYRAYGIGQAKLIYLKQKEAGKVPESIELNELENLVNEDQWLEFVPINLGNWDNTDLRKMSEEAGLKEIYDRYYNWTSGFVHGNWFAIRASVFERCFNPLHRLHRLPTRELPMGNSITDDALAIANMVFELLSRAYPPFEERIKITRVPL